MKTQTQRNEDGFMVPASRSQERRLAIQTRKPNTEVKRHAAGEETHAIDPELYAIVKNEVTLHGRTYRVEKTVARDRPIIVLHGSRGAVYALDKNYFHTNAYFIVHAGNGKFGIVNEFKGEWFKIDGEGNIVQF